MKIAAKSTLKKYWSRVRRHWVLGVLLILTTIGGSTLGSIIPLFFRVFFNLLVGPGSPNSVAAKLVGTLVIIGLLEVARWSFWRVAGFINNSFQPKIIAELAEDCFNYLHKHSYAFFNSNFVGSLVKRVNYFTRAFESTADRITWNFLPLFVELSIVFVVLFRINHWLGLIIFLWMLLFLIVNTTFSAYKIKFDLARSVAETKATGLLADTITNHSNIKLFTGYARESASFKAAQELVRKLRKFTWNLDTVFEAVQGFLAVSLEIGAFYFAVYLWKKGQFTVGDFVLLQTYVIVIFEKIWDFGKILRNMYTDLADAEEMTVILDTPFEIKDIHESQPLKVVAGKIEFKNVDFYYHSTRKIFSRLNIVIKANEKVAFIGPSGAGKSTIVKLLLRLHNLSGGKITIDDQDIARVTQESLWQSVSLVPQDPILFHRTLMENIRYGKHNATDKEVIAAAKLAHCHEFINEFPDKYETFVGERGVKLSGGERQRVAIARAILRNAPILVLDEATSSLDSESEHLIQDALSILMRDKTVIVVAHRLSTIMKMDRIMVVNHGEVIEEGTHQQLLQLKNGLYSKLWTRQAGGFIE